MKNYGSISKLSAKLNNPILYKFNIGDYVDLISYERGIDDFAKQCSTISNEVLTSISNRVKRIYK